MKKLVTISLIIFWTIYVAIIAGGFAQRLETRGNAQNNSSSTTAIDTASLGQITLDTAEVAKHASSSSCWMIIDKKVYDITSYFGSHPGGNYYLSQYCGKDATTAFDVSPHAHSTYAANLLSKYLLGDLGQTINTGTTPTTTTAPSINSNNSSVATGTPAANGNTYTTTTIQGHNNASSCWLIVSGNVYDVTGFLSSNTHRAGNAVIIPYCGHDTTSAFGVHTSSGYSVLSSYYIGTVGTTTTGTGAISTPPASSGTTPSTTRNRHNDDD